MNPEHVFVLMLENRSFDHLFAYSKIHGKDAISGIHTKIITAKDTDFNSFKGKDYFINSNANFALGKKEKDPGHEFDDMLVQLCGKEAILGPNGEYPIVNNSGFIDAYFKKQKSNPEKIMECFDPDKLPILNQLANEFVICDKWFCSVPGPTYVNRLFLHASTSAGSYSLNGGIIPKLLNAFGFRFKNGSIFSKLDDVNIPWTIYHDKGIPMVWMLNDIDSDDTKELEKFYTDIKNPDYQPKFTFIEPSYKPIKQFRGNSMHPKGDVRDGELLIKNIYEAIRANEAIWEKSVLLIMFDESGGFYDHQFPPKADIPVNDNNRYRKDGDLFLFDQLGPRVPCLIISPLIEQNLIDHKIYDHTSVNKSISELFNLEGSLTEREEATDNFNHLFTLDQPRENCPLKLNEIKIQKSVPFIAEAEFDDTEGIDSLLQTIAISKGVNSVKRKKLLEKGALDKPKSIRKDVILTSESKDEYIENEIIRIENLKTNRDLYNYIYNE